MGNALENISYDHPHKELEVSWRGPCAHSIYAWEMLDMMQLSGNNSSISAHKRADRVSVHLHTNSGVVQLKYERNTDKTTSTQKKFGRAFSRLSSILWMLDV